MDPWRLADAWVARSGWILLLVVAVFALAFSWAYVAGNYSATVKLARSGTVEVATASKDSEALMAREESTPSILELLRSTEMFQRTSRGVGGKIAPEDIARRTSATALGPEDPITLTARAATAVESIRLAQAYANAAIETSRELRREQLLQLKEYVEKKLAHTDRDLRDINRQLVESKATSDALRGEGNTLAVLKDRAELEARNEALRLELGTIDLQVTRLVNEITKQYPPLVKAKDDLDRALLRFTDEHPKVKELRSLVSSLREQIAKQATNAQSDLSVDPGSTAGTLYVRLVDIQTQRIGIEKRLEEGDRAAKRLADRLQELPDAQLQAATISASYQVLRARHDLLARRDQELQFLLDGVTSSFRVVSDAREDYVRSSEKRAFAMKAGFGAALLALFLAACLTALGELFDGRIRTPRDLERATQLPVLATLEDLDFMDDEAKEAWAFRTLTVLKGRLRLSESNAMICGFISAAPGEGRSTWIDLLAQAARRRGNRVIVISPPPPKNPDGGPFEDDVPVENHAPTELDLPASLVTTTNSRDADPALQLVLPESNWNLEWSERWQRTLQQWSRMENLVLLVDLPPASRAEALLLSEEIPQLIWLCERDRVTTNETRSQMETIKSSKCEVVGSVLNRAFTPTWRRRFAHFAAMAVILTRMVSSFAAEQPATQSLSVSSPDKLAEWQKRFTLGPGDTFDVKIHDAPDAPARITVGPDGRINFLEAQDVTATGLTVDELRSRLDEVLGKFHRSAKTVIIPTAYNSKRYFVLGNVTRRGTFPLDRPISLVEAVARASGFVNREGIILADLSRSFLVRKNSDASFAPVNVDLEALFLRGDLAQNQAMAPDDYLYFMPSDMPEVYILGEVPGPGNLPYAANLSVLRAIAGRGGFSPKAFRSRVLVVRGSLSQPETFVVNTADILAGRAPDFKLEPRDIVYVSRRPWALAEELLEAAVTDFMRAVLVSWTGANIGPFIKKPVF